MVQVKRYQPDQESLWNRFLATSRNGTFLFHRGYVDYHSDRFTDHSLLFFENDKLVALLPANQDGAVLASHGGLTFGGLVVDRKLRVGLISDLFSALRDYLNEQSIERLIYKAVPHIYHRLPAEEDLYLLYRHGAELYRRDLSSTIRLSDRLPLSKGRKWGAKKGRTQGVTVQRSTDFKSFMAIEEENLQRRYGVAPTHTVEEMELLAGRFPDQIKLFAAFHGEEMVSGTIIYEHETVAHAQYIASTDQGRELAAPDYLFEVLLNEIYPSKLWFDFGISTEDAGRYLNEGLVENKESYGGRGITYDFYQLKVAG